MPGQPEQPEAVPLAAAARRLGTTPESVRMRLRRGKLRGEKRGGLWYVLFPGEHAPEQPTGQRPGEPEQVPGHGELLAHVLEENVYLRRRLEEGEIERAELRRMLNLEQQTVAALRALPAPTPAEMPLERAETVATAPETAEPPDTPPADLTLARELKRAGVKKKQRRKLLERLAGLWR